MALETKSETGNPVPHELLTEEAQRIVYELYATHPAERQIRKKGYHEIRITPLLFKNTAATMLTALKAELPFDEVIFMPRYDDLYLYISYEDEDTHAGVGLADNQKRYRDENGVLTLSLSEVEKLTRAEADAYYIDGGQYICKGILFTYHRYWTKNLDGEDVESGKFTHGPYTHFVDPPSLGTFLPDVASVGFEIVSVTDTRFQPMPCLTKSLRELVGGNTKTE